MPAIGAPATYKRMRAGFEDAESVVLGRNAAEVTAVLANAPGGLELLPTAEYFARIKEKSQAASRPWLRVSRSDGHWLAEGDPYNTIYRDNNPKHWWRMIKEELINPLPKAEGGARASSSPLRSENSKKSRSDFSIYEESLNTARKFHNDLKGKYHDKTFAFYAADADQKTWQEAEWRTYEALSAKAMDEGEIITDDLRGSLSIRLSTQSPGFVTVNRFDLQGPQGAGDGTVPEESGEAPAKYCQQIFKHEGKAKEHASYGHQKCFNNDMTKGVTLYAIAKLAVTSPLLRKA